MRWLLPRRLECIQARACCMQRLCSSTVDLAKPLAQSRQSSGTSKTNANHLFPITVWNWLGHAATAPRLKLLNKPLSCMDDLDCQEDLMCWRRSQQDTQCTMSPLSVRVSSSCAYSTLYGGLHAPDAEENSPGSHAAQALAPATHAQTHSGARCCRCKSPSLSMKDGWESQSKMGDTSTRQPDMR